MESAEGITWSSENRFTRPLRSLDLDRRIDDVFVTTRKKDGRMSLAAFGCRKNKGGDAIAQLTELKNKALRPGGGALSDCSRSTS